MKRIAVTGLWLYSFWYLGSMVSFMLGVPDLLGPLLGIAAGAVVGRDPRHVIWNRSARPAASTQVPVAA